MPRLGGPGAGGNAGTTGLGGGGVGGGGGGRGGAAGDGLTPLVNELSQALDERFFEPLYDSEACTSELEKSLAARFTDYKPFAAIEEKLRTIKVGAAVAGLLCGAMAVSGALQGRPANILVYAVLAHDLFRVSFNCYIKKYVSNASRRLGDNLFTAAANTLLNVISSAVLGKPDVVQRLQTEVVYETLADYTLSQRGLSMLPKAPPLKSKRE